MKYSRAEVHCKTHSLPELRFEDSQLTYRCWVACTMIMRSCRCEVSYSGSQRFERNVS